MYLPAFVEQLRKDNRLLRVHNAQLKRGWKLQRQKIDSKEGQLREMKEQLRRKDKRIQQLEEELEKTKAERDTYKNLTFKERRVCSSAFSHQRTGRKRGGTNGHTGASRPVPEHIHSPVRVYLTHCPDCDCLLERVNAVTTHTVTDLPHWSVLKPFVTQYQIERQWCQNCKKEVHGVPKGIIPKARLGSVFITMILTWRYRFHDSLPKVVERLQTHYGVFVTASGIQHILRRTKQWLGPQYDKLIDEVRGSPVKHADETSWTVGAELFWAWVFVDPKTTVYTIEETRGGGIAKDMLGEAHGVLVRDDYGAYTNLPLLQQSCWAHLLRKSHEAAVREDASEEVKTLHKQLKTLFALLLEDTQKPFEKKEREEVYQAYMQDIQKISNTAYTHADTKRIQTRIRNQGKNLTQVQI